MNIRELIVPVPYRDRFCDFSGRGLLGYVDVEGRDHAKGVYRGPLREGRGGEGRGGE